MRLFITGATGFIGRHLLDHLRTIPDVSVKILTSSAQLGEVSGYSSIVGRLENIADWQQALIDWRPEACIHLAWYAEPGKYLYSEKNIGLLKQSLDLMKVLIDVNCQSVVMVGTVAEYDTSVGYLKETSLTQSATIYAASKLSLSLMAEQMAKDAGINFAWARMFYLYGPGEDERRLVPALIKTLLNGERFETTAGEQVRDYLHVADAASALWHLAHGEHTGIYNISSGYPVTIRELVETVADILDAKDLLDIGALPYRQWEPMFICGNNQKLRATGWKPQYVLNEGLKQVIELWQE